MSIRLKLTVLFLAVSLIPLLFVSALTFNKYQDSLKASRLSQLQDLVNFKADKIQTYFSGLKTNIEIIQDSYIIKKNLPVLSRFAGSAAAAEVLAAKRMLDGVLQKTAPVLGLFDIMLVNPKGTVVYASNPKHYQVESFKPVPDFQQAAFAEGKTKVYFSDVFLSKAYGNAPAMLAAAPVFDSNNVFIGVIIFEVDMEPIYKLIQDVSGLGSTGETLVGKKTGNQVVFLNPLRHDPEAALKRRVDIGSNIAYAMQEAVQGERGAGAFIDYRGKKCIGAWQYLPFLDWGMVAKIDAQEAFADVVNLRSSVIIVLTIIFVLCGIIAFSIAQSISEPVRRLSKGVEIIGSGNLDYKVGTDLNDEIGQLSRSFDKMARDLKKTSASALAERKRLYAVLETLPVYVILLSENHHILFTNRFFRERFGEPGGRPCFEYLFNRNEPCENCETYRVLENNLPHRWEWTGPDSRNYDVHDFPFTDTDGSAMILEMGIDITERKQAEAALRQHQEHLEEIVKERTSQLASKNNELILEVGERKRAEEKLRQLNRTLKALSDSSQVMSRSTSELEYLDKVCKIIVEDCGHPMVWVGLAEEDEAKTVRPVAYAGFESGYLNTLNINWADTPRGRGPTGTAIRTGKPAICANMLTDPSFGPWREEAIKRGYASSIVLPLMEKGRAFGAINIYSRKPDAFPEEEAKLLIELADDLAYGIIAIRLRIAHDRAEEVLKRDKETLEKLIAQRSRELVDIQMELEKAKRLSDIGALAAIVAHELRNPLAAIGIAAYNIKRKAQNPLLDKHLQNIEKKISESDQIINNLLFYSRLRPPHYENINIYDILVECINISKAQFKKKVLFKKGYESLKSISIEADPLQMKEIFSNILINAHDAVSDETGIIELECRNEKEYVEVSVRDNGIGIEKEDLVRVFDPFFSTKAKGTGLGLTVCNQIVNMHGGSIQIKSDVGKGTIVTVTLPKTRKKA